MTIHHSTKYSVLIPILGSFLSSCASSDIDAPAQAIPSLPTPFIGEKKVVETPKEQAVAIVANSQFYAQNQIYKEIADGVASRGALSSEYFLQSTRFSHEAFR